MKCVHLDTLETQQSLEDHVGVVIVVVIPNSQFFVTMLLGPAPPAAATLKESTVKDAKLVFMVQLSMVTVDHVTVLIWALTTINVIHGMVSAPVEKNTLDAGVTDANLAMAMWKKAVRDVNVIDKAQRAWNVTQLLVSAPAGQE